jgi:hypothetical protein
MTTLSCSPTLAQARAEFEELIKGIRPELHRGGISLTELLQ